MPHRSPRALLLWAVAALVAVVTAVVVAGDLATLHRRAGALGPEGTVVVAARALPVGRLVQPGDVTERRVHRSQAPAGVLGTAGAAVGRVVVVPVLRGGFVAAGNLTARHRSGLDGVVPAGMRALRVVVTDSLRPSRGAVVDVLATDDRGDTAGSAQVAAAGVQVIATDTRDTSGGGRAGAFGVTLLVDPDQAAELAAAQAAGMLTLALVPPESARAATRR